MNKHYSLLTLLVFSHFLAGCASVTTGHNQTVTVDTGSETGACCTLTNDKNSWTVNSTPSPVEIQRSGEDLKVTCKNGAKSGSTTVPSSTNGMVFGNLIVGGIMGAVTDCQSGAAYQYPSTISVKLS